MSELMADLEVAEELKDEFDRWMAIQRGNERIERELIASQRQSIEVTSFIFMRLDAITAELLGDPRIDKRRLDFEIKFAENMRSALTRAKLKP